MGDVRAWWTANSSTFRDISGADLGVTEAMINAALAVARERSLTAPAVKQACASLVTEARNLQTKVDAALALPPIPDASSNVEWQDMIALKRRYADAALRAGSDVDVDAMAQVEALGPEIKRRSDALFAEVAKVWPDDDLPSWEA